MNGNVLYWIAEHWDGYRLVKREILKTHEAIRGVINTNRQMDLVIKLVYDGQRDISEDFQESPAFSKK